jgi:hypothetical protein
MPIAGLWLLVILAAVVLVLAWLVRRWHARDEARFQWELDHPRRLRERDPQALPPPSRADSRSPAGWRRSHSRRDDE